MRTSNKIVVQLIVEQCIANGMKHIVCSPGSRNAPLVIAFDEHPSIECFVIHDERSAAFFALGMSMQLNAPVGVLCTSGSASANYFPAVSEAFYQGIKLVVLTADRPEYWINQGDGQTIQQKNIFGDHVQHFCHFNENQVNEDGRWFVQRETAIAFSKIKNDWSGPIHFNIGMNEPLYDTVEIEKPTARVIELIKGQFSIPPHLKGALTKILSLPKKMILVGQLVPDDAVNLLLAQLANDSSLTILVENTSNVQNNRFIHCIDRALNVIKEEEIEHYQPDLLITLGGAIVSKKVKAFLRKSKPQYHWKVGSDFEYMDTYQSLTHSFPVDTLEFLKEINDLQYERSTSNYGGKWKQLDMLAKDKMSLFLGKTEFSDLKVFESLLDFVPDNTNLHMANSSVVRYCQLFDPIPTIQYRSNRGTSGIDGSTSTAAGAAFVSKDQLNVLITGDISFFYDSNALWNHYLGNNFRIILINNGGGGIFRFIPGPLESKQSAEFFEAQHQFEAKEICAAFDVNYLKVEDLESLEQCMADFYAFSENNRPKLIEIITPREKNDLVLKDFFKKLAQ
ncbi:MAG: 2-succinyl-5-enolpyruvyl-6-hydroxy-3-cyclohexene-1-carboxylic-acid synthase [Bacteroidota bacterium]